MKKAYLVLSDGSCFEGQRFGYETDSTGELVFTTGMVGYLETLTDPSYFGQIVLQTFPLIGNYGVIPDDFESAHPWVRGYVVREFCDSPSNFRAAGSIDAFLKDKRIPGICGVDTRQITRRIREYGVMNAVITADPNAVSFDELQRYRVSDAVIRTTCRSRYVCEPVDQAAHRVALIDYGAKANIIRELTRRGCRVEVFPADTAAEEILASEPDGVMLSNGPGDPADNVYQIEQIRRLLGKKPLFGICLGHQLTAIAAGASTMKLKYGHRGANQPVKRLSDGRVFISSQNHGYAVDSGTINKTIAAESYLNANDGTNEGLDYPSLNAFTVQFHPEACSGPKDTSFLFDRFTEMMRRNA